ncbi:MbtF [uncultured Desulfovibrio sp.]|uniref:MbtF n=1 Tax=Candidatus Desulfovibrio intestinavium TaxID=2838534 RepID=A0A9D2HLM0_9BACT|nr:MbtF [uncultured Desulfovibrio sp.]HJA78084.1 MbtF [Candidatus Desulfovibrio intestinavium]
MRKFFAARQGVVLTFLLSVSGLAACGSKEEALPPDAQGMTVEVDFRPVHRCSRISPNIIVTNAPRGTAYFEVRLMEQEPVERLLGGGTWSHDGSGQIPEGGLTKLYSGPCPPAGKERRYVYAVSAMPFGGGQPLSVRTAEIFVEGK